MQQEQDVLILKPTPVFLSFLAAQLPNIELPALNILQTDTTAYTINKQSSDEATLDEIEHLFPLMFRHEIQRWLGKDAENEIEGSFLDFLCCFKFELHSQLLILEPSLDQGKQLLCIKPRSVLLKWFKSVVQEEHTEPTQLFKDINLNQVAENATVFVKNFNDLNEINHFIRHYYRAIYKAEMMRLCDQADFWPEVPTFDAFSRYFTFQIHTQLVHLHQHSPLKKQQACKVNMSRLIA